MLNDKPIPTIMAECCGSCMFFINNRQTPWCIKRFDLSADDNEKSTVMAYYVCSRYSALESGIEARRDLEKFQGDQDARKPLKDLYKVLRVV